MRVMGPQASNAESDGRLRTIWGESILSCTDIHTHHTTLQTLRIKQAVTLRAEITQVMSMKHEAVTGITT